MDQLVANQIGHQTRFASLEVGLEEGMQGLPSLKRDGARVFRAADRPSGLARKPTGLPGRRQLLLKPEAPANRFD